MAGANVSLNDIDYLRSSIDSAGNNSLSTISSLQNEVNSAISGLDNEAATYGNAAGCAESAIGRGSAKESQLISKISSLESRLASTPPTIQVYVSDNSESGGHYESRPNPEYSALVNEISATRSRLYGLQSLLGRMRELSGEASEGQRRASSLKSDCLNINDNLNSIYRDIQSIQSDCVKKLQKIQLIVEEYTRVDIDMPIFAKEADYRLS